MDAKKSQLLRGRLQAIISTIENENERNRSGRISWSLACDYNRIIDDFTAEFPEYKDQFPQKINGTHGQRLGYGDASFLDLRIKADQVVKIVEVLTEGN
ncbi:MAG TPA: hypothetical protein DD473_03650 [Planctomycetaceae bacterium]|nr:hypothetical protein [Planctomycetaceae bacterium]|tara:strand:- start:221 stop:517 length:297 start_codon:yes stop_codon:yes gene_type:complete